MENIKNRNLYLPILHKTKFYDNSREESNSSFTQVHGKNNIANILKLIQRKKAQLQKNIENQQSDDSSDNEQNTQLYSHETLNKKNKIISLQSSKLHGFQEKVKTTVDQNSEPQSSSINKAVQPRHFRVRTQHNQNSCKSTQNTSKIMKKIKVLVVQNQKPLIKFLKPKQMSRQITKLLPSVPTKIKQRNQTTLKNMAEFLQQQNPFFMKLEKVVVICLLKVCKIVHKCKRQTIYERQSIQDRFYIILGGRVKIANTQNQLKKVCVPGETILEQTWVNFNENKPVLSTTQKARSIGSSYLLQIPLEKFKKVKEELMKFGFKTQYIQLQALIKRNFIHKNAIRKQKNKF